MRFKVGIVGAGNVGGTTAQRIAERDYADIVLLDIPDAEGLAKGKALDIQESGPVLRYETKLTGSCRHTDLEGCDLVVEIELSQDEKAALDRSVEAVRELLAVMKRPAGA